MSPMERLRWAIAADLRRSMTLMLGGIAVFSAVGVAATLFELPRSLSGPLVLLMLVAWLVGLCGMVGYFRWFFRSEVDGQTRR
jgi:hypothetical protein